MPTTPEHRQDGPSWEDRRHGQAGPARQAGSAADVAKAQRGPPGATGPIGKTGGRGKQGKDGKQGQRGKTGARGRTGARGAPGKDGAPGTHSGPAPTMKALIFAAVLLLCAGGSAAHSLDISQLKGVDVPEGLKQFIGTIVTELHDVKNENAELQNRTQVVEAELRNKTLVEEELRGEIRWLKKDRDAFQNKTRVVEAENAALKGRVAALEGTVYLLSNQTKKDIRRINARLDQCEADSFAQVVERRRTQEQTPVCGREAVDSMLAVCCTSGAPAGNGHRLQEFVGCDSLPPTCSLECSYQFISIFDNCHDQALMRGLLAEELADWTSFYAVCSEVEQSAAEMGALQPVNVRMFRIMISSDAAQSQAEMFGGGQTQPIIGPLPELPPPPPASTSDFGSTEVQEYHAQCTTSNILTCVPACNATHHGYELLANIDGTDTKFSCNLANMLFSWVGAAALGGYLGSDVKAFLSAVLSGASGTYFLHTQIAALEINTDLIIRPGQHVRVAAEGARWGRGGIIIQDQSSLQLIGVALFVSIAVESGICSLSLRDCDMVLPTPLVVPVGANMTLRAQNTRVGVIRTADTFASFPYGIAVDGALTMQSSGLTWGSNVYIGVIAAEGGAVQCNPCDVSMTPL
eukprot:SAG22_NODE_2690_length_2307_cov_46.005435_1_plen_633_part_10